MINYRHPFGLFQICVVASKKCSFDSAFFRERILYDTDSFTCSIELFQDMCGELRDWMNEKRSVLASDDLGKDMRTVQALQRKHQVGGLTISVLHAVTTECTAFQARL